MNDITSKTRGTKMKPPIKSRNWTCIVYPESAPEKWKDRVREWKIQGAISPLHDKDINKKDNTEKKAHYHLMLAFDGVKSLAQMKELMCDELNAAQPQVVHSLTGMTRYLCHLDNADKYQYDVKDIEVLAGFDLDRHLVKSISEKYKHLNDMMAFIADNDISEFSDFINYCRQEEYTNWFPLVVDRYTYVIIALIKSNRFKTKI